MNTLPFLRAKGRLSRGQFWVWAVVAWLLFYLIWDLLGGRVSPLWVGLINLPMLAVLAVLCIRRLHDRDYSGWWLLIGLVPVAGAAWLLWQTAIRRGLRQSNRWGEDPLQEHGDYLVVQ